MLIAKIFNRVYVAATHKDTGVPLKNYVHISQVSECSDIELIKSETKRLMTTFMAFKEINPNNINITLEQGSHRFDSYALACLIDDTDTNPESFQDPLQLPY